VPASHLSATKTAIFATGAGRYFTTSDATTAQAKWPTDPLYENVALETTSIGLFTPGPASNPHLGDRGKEERAEEIRVEIRCAPGDDGAAEAVKALKKTHPYEIIGYEVYKIENF